MLVFWERVVGVRIGKPEGCAGAADARVANRPIAMLKYRILGRAGHIFGGCFDCRREEAVEGAQTWLLGLLIVRRFDSRR